jgi:hypothetical protein
MAEIDQWVADNYDAIVADKRRGVTYESLAEDADAKNAPDLAAWARAQAAKAGADVTPVDALPDVKSVRADK